MEDDFAPLPGQPAPPPAGAASDWTIEQNWEDFAPAEHKLWDQLFARQLAQLEGKAASVFLRGLDLLKISKPGIPELRALNQRLASATGWSVVAVPGLVPDAIFFEHLANRRFPAGNFIRRADQLDYLKEPDVFHDIFGHVPMLADPVFADYMQAYGQGGLRSLNFGALDRLARLYWYTVEFGLVEEAGGLRIYGAGIVSSNSETEYALASPLPHRIGFDLIRVMRTLYRIDAFQQSYFVVPDFASLLHTTRDTDFAPVYARLQREVDLDPSRVSEDDRIFL